MSLDKWDTCAGEAILKGCGGWVTDFEGKEIDYSKHIASFVACGSLKVYEKVKLALP